VDLKVRGLVSACTEGGRLFHWTVISGMKLRIQYVGVVALRRGRTQVDVVEQVIDEHKEE